MPCPLEPKQTCVSGHSVLRPCNHADAEFDSLAPEIRQPPQRAVPSTGATPETGSPGSGAGKGAVTNRSDT